ncbi:Lrp/AsnC ligand binding domain-containing protein [Candidatus Bathyarchaeota archaeon]|jgi:DNA-binding Lrp family transcriptional regulator|nr:Lrp/AsnC ligand binding domain-containing protein [Candidatus Bathyarchaeota archaeon]MBT4319606.1 Lrp/AsnC ligand binding domain-containing protein [Candidatus Bathyarchaeota archaeon]MBT4424964.1 Lrp/AsnC ligand binding domain-containing protein [Candidatus Bathyarchaeota archaeon]MBT5642613.1 Lrp/AsnC ligand binding domain-containing protein [Candidatus Bathyarchaeota archaeon]MBT6605525.1 Lrp/AsnC ligand binding domain-containing protein [Candidatus Bathyarchaeota archaeon]
MTQALVLLLVDPKIESSVLTEIRATPGVLEANYIYGPYDIYVKIEGDTKESIRNLIFDKIRGLYGIQSTTTCLIYD